MDGYRDHPSDFDLPAANETPPTQDVSAAIGTDERRMHVRAYNHWVSLLDGRDYPSIEDLEPGDLEDFSAHSVLLDFTSNRDEPATPYIGTAIREECGLGDSIRTIADVPSRSLLSRLTDHYMQIIANRAPVGFEAEFENQRGISICYRGILMPFSSDGDTIDFIYGVINWKAAGAPAVAAPIAPPAAEPDEVLELDERVEQPAQFSAVVPMLPPEIDEAAPLELAGIADELPSFAAEEDSAVEEPLIELPEIELGDDAGLADWLCAARECADEVKSADHRSRAALYGALARAYDFAVAAQREPDDYAELLAESGVKAQARAPMTPIVKLVFGIDYDKTRLTEFASALAYAQRQSVGLGGFKAFIDSQPGGLKALVAAERQARRPERRPDSRGDQARARLREAVPLSLADLPDSDEFCLVITRRGADGTHEPVALVTDSGLLDRAILKSAA